MSVLTRFFIFPKLFVCYAYDAVRFGRSAHLFGPFKSRNTARAHLMRLAHSLEKGMALPAPRRGFGDSLAAAVLADLDSYIEKFSPDEASCCVLTIVESTLDFHARHGVDWPEHSLRAKRLRDQHEKIHLREETEVGTVHIHREDVLGALPKSPESFFHFRRSVRQFAPEPITREEVERAVRLAQRSPSVCNRQGGRVYAYTDKAEREHVLSFQDGNAGFGDMASVIFVVTSEMSIFYKNGERNQAFVDGGLFAMSLVFALHTMGFGSCLLNWSRGPKEDFRFRKALGIPDTQVVITLLAAGRLLPEYSVAASPRNALEEVLHWGR